MKQNLLLILMFACMALLQGQHLFDNMDDVKVEGVGVQGKLPEGQGNWFLWGREAKVTDNIIVMHGCRLVIKNKKGEEYVIRSYRCIYMKNMKVIKSTSPVYFSSGESMKGSGIGYDVFFDKNKVMLKIRSHVRVELEMPRHSVSDLVENKEKEKAK